jgi:serine/threonine protein kinase
MQYSTPTLGQIGHYRLQQLLGQSDLSEVYLAEHAHSQQQVAIKLLYGRWTGEEAQRFLAQTTALTRLQHPHIMPIIDFGIEDDRAFMVMTYAAQGTLRQRHPRGSRLPINTILSYAQQVESALTYIHEQGLVHRDVKPHNLLIDQQEHILLSDFGTATVSYSMHPQPASLHDFEGTVIYAAPEQLRGQSRRSSDQYALAIMIYEWLCGTWPFDGSFQEITHQHLFVPAPPLATRNIDCPPHIEEVLLRALEKDPLQRFPSVKLFVDELTWSVKIAQAKGQFITYTADTPPQLPSIAPSPLPRKTTTQFKSPLPFQEEA